MARKKNDGKELENVLQAALTRHAEKYRTTFGRFYDATSSGGKGHTQSGDFFWLLKQSVLIECKSTDIGIDIVSLIRSSKTSRAQVARHRVWHLAGHPSVYFYLDTDTREVRAYDGRSIVAAVPDKRIDLLVLLAVSSVTRIDLLLEKLVTTFNT